MSKKNRIRLMTDMPLTTGVQYTADEAQTHYLKNVMRLSCGDEVFLFDGRNGEFQSTIIQISKKNLILEVHQKVFTFEKSPDVWLLFAPLKKENTDIVIQKAVELGVSKIVPVQTQYCTNTNIKKERIKAAFHPFPYLRVAYSDAGKLIGICPFHCPYLLKNSLKIIQGTPLPA